MEGGAPGCKEVREMLSGNGEGHQRHIWHRKDIGGIGGSRGVGLDSGRDKGWGSLIGRSVGSAGAQTEQHGGRGATVMCTWRRCSFFRTQDK
jgi:hypothetical protein